MTEQNENPEHRSEDAPRRIGVRIATLRKVHGSTQRGLASRANVSYSLLRKVETGDRAASPAFVAAIARALHVNVTDITDQPFYARNASPQSEQSGVPALRQALVEGEDPEECGERRSISELSDAVRKVKEFDRRTRHAEAVRALPDILRHLHRAAHEVGGGEQLVHFNEMLSASYSYALIALYRLGHLDLAHLADERARLTASRGDDSLRAAVGEWNHALILLFDGSYAAGLRSVDRTLDLTDQAPSGQERSAIRGAAHLRAAILAARSSRGELAESHLAEAQGYVMPEHEESNHYGTKFGSTNVDIHRIAVPVELADGTSAVERAASITLPPDTAPSRAGHYWIDLARGWLLHGNRDQTVASLQTARSIAPQLTRYHPQVHETISAMATRDRRSSNSVVNLAAWCGMRV